MAEENKKSKLKIIIIVAVALVVLGVAVFAGVYTYMSKNGDPEVVAIVENYYEIGEMTVNLSDENKSRYVNLNLTVTYDSENTDLLTEMETKQVALKDTAIFYLKSLSAEDFAAGKEMALKKDLVDKLNKNLTQGLIIDAMFDQLIVQ